MNSDDIDDFLSNIDENFDESNASADSSKLDSSAEKNPLKELNKESFKEIKLSNDVKEIKNIPRTHDTSDLSFLENIDPDVSGNNNEEYEKKIKEELSQEQHGNKSEESLEKSKTVSPAVKPEDSENEIPEVNFIIKGTRSWNTREPYVLPVNHDKLKNDYKDLTRTFYIIKAQDKEQNIHGEMKRAMFKFMRDAGEKDILQGYPGFVIERLFLLTEELSNYFGFQKDKVNLFIYHLGVLTLYKIILSTFETSGTGYCYKIVADNKVSKYIPLEFVKEIVLKWHNENISNNDLPFDGIIEYNEIKRIVSGRYTAEYEKYNSKLDASVAKSNVTLSPSDREQIFKTKWNEWFGKKNILIYNRFLERTIFKMVK